MSNTNAIHFITSSERETQDLLIEKIIRYIPKFKYIGKLDNDFNKNIREDVLMKYLIDCGGNAFTLQRLLGHSTLTMSKRYCNIYDTDIARDYDAYSPLTKMSQKRERIQRR